MGGEVSVSSELGRGTAIVVEVPFEASNHEFPRRRDSDRSFDDFSVRMSMEDPQVQGATLAALAALSAKIVPENQEHETGRGELRFLIVDGGGGGDSATPDAWTAHPDETVILLSPRGFRPDTGGKSPNVQVVSKPLTRRKLATALVDQAAPEHVATPHAEQGTARRDPTGPKILVVEDSRDSQRYVLRVLEDASFRVDLASDGEEGFAMAMDGAFDLIVSDVQMPDVDGLEMTRRIREAERRTGRPRVPIIALRPLICSPTDGCSFIAHRQSGVDNSRPILGQEIRCRFVGKPCHHAD
jgi:hypothetical protein